jgi:hypothetical protein
MKPYSNKQKTIKNYNFMCKYKPCKLNVLGEYLRPKVLENHGIHLKYK